jgi:transcription elongation factor Elf1
MATNKHIECNGCNAVFNVKHDLDKKYYKVTHCAFCGESLDNEEYEVEDDADE